MIPTTRPDDWLGLSCANCGGDNLHHASLRSFSRRKEDGASSLVVVRGSDVVTEAETPHENPSSRRGAVQLFFACETCEGGSVVTFIQHKGITYVRHEKWLDNGKFFDPDGGQFFNGCW